MDRSAPERIVERARAVGADAVHKVDHTLRAAQGKTGDIQAALADAIEAGAESLREASLTVVPRGRRRMRATPTRRLYGAAAALVETAAERMDRIAIWLRENELANPASMVERQLRERPGRFALLGLALGFMIGHRLRRRRT